MSRTILLADMNAFFASVEQAENPSFKGKPLVVCGEKEKRHGIVLAASYEAKRLGVKTGMLNAEARAVAPGAIFLPPRHRLYVDFSLKINRIMRDFTDLVEPFSIDESFLDVTPTLRLFGSGATIARRLQERIGRELGIPCSVGVSCNKLLAKLAAEMEKPNGLTLLKPEDVPARVWPLPVRQLFGVGPRTEKKLRDLGILKIGDLARFPPERLKKRFGLIGMVLYLNANGIDESPVNPEAFRKDKSIGHQLTLPRDYTGYADLRVAILDMAEMVCRRVRQGGYVGKTIFLALRDSDLQGYGWAKTLPEYTDLAEDVYQGCSWLLLAHWPEQKRVRMVGVSLANLTPKKWVQEDLMGHKQRLERIAAACDRLKDKYGEDIVLRASSLTGAGIFRQKVRQ